MKIKECPIRNSKNAWLYDDADDGESEDSFARFLHSGKNSGICHYFYFFLHIFSKLDSSLFPYFFSASFFPNI